MAGGILWGVGGVVLLLAALKLLSPWLGLMLVRLRPGRVLPLPAADVPRYLEQLAGAQRQRLEALGFRLAGFVETHPTTFEMSPVEPQMILANDAAKTLAFLRVSDPFSPARPMAVMFETPLSDGTLFVTSDEPVGSIGVFREHYQACRAPDDEAIYREHLNGVAKSGAEPVALPRSIEEIAALDDRDGERVWQANVDSRWYVRGVGDTFRFARWKLLGQTVSLRSRLARAGAVVRQREELARGKYGGASVSSPEIDLFLRQRASFQKAATDALVNRVKESRAQRTVMRIIGIAAAVLSFIVVWRWLSRSR